jgi:hypothetical protein
MASFSKTFHRDLLSIQLFFLCLDCFVPLPIKDASYSPGPPSSKKAQTEIQSEKH